MKKNCVIISGSPEYDLDFIRACVSDDKLVVCADKGLHYALLAGVTPNAAVGDFDSCPPEADFSGARIVLPRRKDVTDTMYAADYAADTGCESVTILCATGGRLDHTLGNLAVLERMARRGVSCEILSPDERIVFLTKGVYLFNDPDGVTFSMLPYGCSEVVVSSTGVEYPLCEGRIGIGETVGISNVFRGGSAEFKIHSGSALIIINRSV